MKAKEQKIVHVSIPFECPFNVGFACMLDDDIDGQLECGENLPHECPLILNDYVVSLVRDRNVE